MNASFFRGVLVGTAAVAALAVFGPGAGRSAQPAMRRAMKFGIKAWEQSREAFSELAETAEDAFAEAWEELKSEAEARRETAKTQPAPDVSGSEKPVSADDAQNEQRSASG